MILFEYSVEDWVGRRDGRSVYPRMVTPLGVTNFSPGLVSTQLPPASPARSTMTDPATVSYTARMGRSRFIAATWLARRSLGAGRPAGGQL